MQQQKRRTGCWVCWQRKLKCDSFAPNHCTNCAKRGVECRYEDASTCSEPLGRTIASKDVTEAGIRRERTQRACLNCAAQKLKCSGGQDGCQRCTQNELVCQYPTTKRASRKRAIQSRQGARRHSQGWMRQPPTVNEHSSSDEQNPLAHNSPSPAVSQQSICRTSRQKTSPKSSGSFLHELDCTRDTIRRYADAYFEHVYPITTHGFLHQGTFLQELDEKKTPGVLLKAIAVCASPFVAPATRRTEQTIQWAHDVDIYIMNNLGSFSILNLQILILWASHHHSSGNLGKAWMLHGMSARLAYCLEINENSTIGSTSTIECRRRMMWSIRILDRLFAGTVEEFSLCSNFLDGLKLPCDEYFYLAEIPVQTDTLKGFMGKMQIPNIGTFAGLVGLLDIWRDILLFMRDLSGYTEVEEMTKAVFALRQKLFDFEQQLPPNLKFINRNLYLHPNSAQKTTFIMLRSWWHECTCDLYRFSLPGFRETVDLTSQNSTFVKQCRQQVLRSALAQSNFWRSISNSGYQIVSDQTLVVLVHSNTRTLLACQKLGYPDGWEDNTASGETNDFSVLLASNVTLLDELAKRLPRVAVVQREIQTLIQKNGFQGSSEVIMCDGLPLKRRHSRQDLLDNKRRQEEQGKKRHHSQVDGAHGFPTQSLMGMNTTVPSADAPGPWVPESSFLADNRSSMVSVNIPNGVTDFYTRTPVSMEGGHFGQVELQEHYGRETRSENGQIIGQRNLELNPLQETFGEADLGEGQFFRSYEENLFGEVLGYFAPLETAMEDDVFAATNFMGI